jgi:D-sedoheptulose 7-phosphate isomerase
LLARRRPRGYQTAGASRAAGTGQVADHDIIDAHLRRSIDALERAAGDTALRAAILAIAQSIEKSLRAGGKVLLAGNGGSAADAQHIAGEFLSRLRFDRHPLPAIALTTDSSVLTAVGNDYGYERVFERQLRGLGRAGDVFIAISTSGKSPNVIAALRAAREIGIVTAGFTGTAPGAATMRPLCDHILAAPSDDTPLIQQIHITVAHVICEMVERNLFKS